MTLRARADTRGQSSPFAFPFLQNQQDSQAGYGTMKDDFQESRAWHHPPHKEGDVLFARLVKESSRSRETPMQCDAGPLGGYCLSLSLPLCRKAATGLAWARLDGG